MGAVPCDRQECTVAPRFDLWGKGKFATQTPRPSTTGFTTIQVPKRVVLHPSSRLIISCKRDCSRSACQTHTCRPVWLCQAHLELAFHWVLFSKSSEPRLPSSNPWAFWASFLRAPVTMNPVFGSIRQACFCVDVLRGVHGTLFPLSTIFTWIGRGIVWNEILPSLLKVFVEL